MIEQLLKLKGFQILKREEQKHIFGGDLQTDVYCKDGTGFSIHPDYPFNPNTMCADHGGFQRLETYDV
jgi:hypothetical protein